MKENFAKKYARSTSTVLLNRLKKGIEFDDERNAIITILEKRGKDVSEYKVKEEAPIEEKVEETIIISLEDLAEKASDYFDIVAESGDSVAYEKIEEIITGRDFVDMDRSELESVLAIEFIVSKKEEPVKEKEESNKVVVDSNINDTRRKDVLLVDPKLLKIEEGFNTRFDYGDIDELKSSIIENGVRIPLRGYKEGEYFYIVDGHRRYSSIVKAIKEGHDIARVPFISEKKRSLEERVFDIILSNDGKQLTPLELGETYKKLSSYGYNSSEIAKKIGKTVKHVIDMIDVANSSKELKDMINDNNVTATLVCEVKRAVKDDEKAEKIIKEKVEEKRQEVAKSGEDKKPKVTKKDLKNVIEKQPDNSKNNSPYKNIDDIKENSDVSKAEKVDEYISFSKEQVKELLLKQIEKCKEVLPEDIKGELDNVELVIK